MVMAPAEVTGEVWLEGWVDAVLVNIFSLYDGLMLQFPRIFRELFSKNSCLLFHLKE